MANSSSTALHRALDNIGICKGAADFPECGGEMRQAMGPYALDMLHLPGWAPCPEPANEREVWKEAKNNIFSVLSFMTEGSAHITVRAHMSKEVGGVGDGAAAGNTLKQRFDGNARKARPMKPGGDPVDFIAIMDDLRLLLEDMRERIFDDTYADVLMNSLPKELEFMT